tara:strand:+ start:914 stop:1426 length:513 start_codon:yes stop_codon:yes gene_type:complete
MNNNFDKDLADGQKGEQAVRHFVETVMEKQFKKYNDNANYDILFQNPYEDPVTFEVKTDYWEKNIDEGGSGNMAIEYKCRGKPSGIRTTKATYFAYYFPNIRDKHLWVITVDNLKKLLKNCVSKRVNGGETYYDSDEKVAKCFLIDRYRYRKHFDVYSWDGRGWIDDTDF